MEYEPAAGRIRIDILAQGTKSDVPRAKFFH